MVGYLFVYDRPPPTKEEMSIPGIKAKYSTPKYGILQRGTLSLYKNSRETSGESEHTITLDGCSITEMHVKHGSFDRSNYLRIFHPSKAINSKGDRTLYLWCEVGYELERWYHALRSGVACSRGSEPDLSHISHFAAASQMCTSLGNTVSPPIGAINALTHRLWWTLHREKLIESIVIKEAGVVISHVQLPPIVKYLKVSEISFGANVPFVTNASLTNFSSKGELTMDCLVDYKGGAVIKLACCVSVPVPNVGKVVTSAISSVSSQIIGSSIFGSGDSSNNGGEMSITAALTVVVYVKKFTGKLRVMCLAPPSRTIWIGFHEEPVIDFAFDTILDASASSLVSSRIPKVTEAIASVVRTEIADILVLPQMDNIEIPDLEKLAGSSSSSSSSSLSSPLSSPLSSSSETVVAAAPPLPPKASSTSSSLTTSAESSTGVTNNTLEKPKDVPEIPIKKSISTGSMQNLNAPPRPPKASASISLSTASMPSSGDESFDSMFPPVPRQRKVPSQQNVE